MEALIKLVVFLVLVAVGYWRGRRNERAHLLALAAEEERLVDVLVFSSRYPPRMDVAMDPVLVTGSAVVGSDHFRLFLASLRKIVGGNYRAYENLLERGRRQALLRVKEAARAHGANMVFNIRYATSRISSPQLGEATQVEVIAYGTAFVPAAGSVAQSQVRYVMREHWPEHDGEDILKNRHGRYWVIGWFALVFYTLGEMVTANLAPPSWRYVNGAPWLAFWLLSVLICGGLLYGTRRKGVEWGWGIVLTVLSVPALTASLYFVALRLNSWTAPPARAVEFRVQVDGRFVPLDPAYPVLVFDDDPGFAWTIKPDTKVQVPVVCGALGVCQYDWLAVRELYHRYYKERK